MKKIPIHRLANLFPPPSDEDQKEIVDTMKDGGGQRFPIVLYEGKILDGRCRYAACVDLGIEPRTVQFKGKDPLGFVIAANLARRHLTTAQKAETAHNIAQERIHIACKESASGTDNHHKLSESAAYEAAAAEVGVSVESVRNYAAIKDKPEVLSAVRNGEVSLNAAAKSAKELPKKDPEPVRCCTGATIPKELIPLWERKGEVLALMKQVAALENRIKEARNTKDVLFSTLDFCSVITKLQNIHQELRAIQLYAVCTSCNGRTPKTCTLCQGRGLLSQWKWELQVPEEARRMKRV